MCAKRINKRITPPSIGLPTVFSMIGVAFLAASVLGLYYVIDGGIFSTPIIWAFVFAAFAFLGLLSLIGWGSIKISQRDFKVRLAYENDSTTTTADIVDRGRGQSLDFEGNPRTVYWVAVKFQPMKADGKTKNLVLRAVVNKRLFDRSEPGGQLKVRYANANPRLALLEGETRNIERELGFVDLVLRWTLVNVIGGAAGFYIGRTLGIDDLLISGAIAGLVIGLAQWLVIFMYIPIPNWLWVLGSVAGWAVFVRFNTLIYGLVGGTVLGVVQWSVLRRRLTRAEWWVVSTAFGMTLGQIAFNLVAPTTSGTFAGFVFDLLYGGVTGTMLYLITNHTLEAGAPGISPALIAEPILSPAKSPVLDGFRSGLDGENLKLVVNGRLFSDNPDEGIIQQVLRDLLNQEGGYAILSRTEMSYIQTAYEDDGIFIMEYQSSLDNHYACVSAELDLAKVTRAFNLFLHASEELETEFSWEWMQA